MLIADDAPKAHGVVGLYREDRYRGLGGALPLHQGRQRLGAQSGHIAVKHQNSPASTQQ